MKKELHVKQITMNSRPSNSSSN